MVFPFTFKLSVPGIANPFSGNGAEDGGADLPPGHQPNPAAGRTEKIQITRRRPSPAPSDHLSAPTSRKRGWDPAFASPSASATTLASPSGYLDTPAKYRDQLASMTEQDMREIEELTAAAVDVPPPPKRRRGLAGSIVSTALSAALIGTAVGLTVYRMWRDRGKDSPEQQIAPPPYHEGEWEPASQETQNSERPKGVYVTPPTPRSRKPRAIPASTRRHAHPRRTHVRHAITPPPRAVPMPVASSSVAAFPEPQPEFDFSSNHHEEQPEDPDDQMDWIGEKLSALIAEGQKALGREVVVMSEAQEDEVDDGSGQWEDEEPAAPRASSSRRGSIRGRLPPPSYAASSYQSRPTSRSSSRGHGLPSTPSMSGMEFGVREETTFESPELRASMEAARARYMRNRAGVA
ncbi:hypothetical protein K525DRAFT_232186 [Schizophyllum commune Loenen D]|nr:hypothetical protein K525DRAFT_232186 [Schizophyllum commune Loenen D]